MALHLNNLDDSSPKDVLYQIWLKLIQWFLRRRFLNFVNVFLLFRNYLPLGKGGTVHLNKLELSSHTDALCQICLILNQWFLKFSQCVFAISYLSTLGKGRNPSFEQTKVLCQFPSTKDALWQVWLKLAKWFLRRRFMNLVNAFSLFRKYLLLEKGNALWIPFIQWCSVLSLVEIGQVDRENKMNMWKVYEDNDDGQRTNFYQKSSLEPSAHVN